MTIGKESRLTGYLKVSDGSLMTKKSISSRTIRRFALTRTAQLTAPVLLGHYSSGVMVAAGLVVGGGAVVAAPLVLSAAGFTAGGVAAGSAAAFVQSMIGNVAAGSWFALCQSAGAAGIATSSSAVIGTVGTAVGSAAAGVSGLFKGKKRGKLPTFICCKK